jgi:hypothetical protein
MKKLLRIFFVSVFLSIACVSSQPTVAFANHAWGNYHWARTNNPFVVRLGDNVSPQWKSYLSTAAYNWNRSTVLSVPVIAGSTAPNPCRMISGTVQVCSAVYGTTGWMGLAQLTVNGDHITAATVRLNDSYFNTARFNTPAWRNLVICQEIGHTFGLAHQDENFNNAPLGTCMDYSSDPTLNQHPNLHDYYELLTIYNHRDTFSSSQLAADDTALANDSTNDRSSWGRLVKGSEPSAAGDTSLAATSGHIANYERDLGAGKKLQTTVMWVK